MRRPRLHAGKRFPKPRPSVSDLRRFLAKVRQERWCWVWRGHHDANGYGQFWFRGRAVWAHRFAYAVFKGTIPDNRDVDHRCRRHDCVNPQHLRVLGRNGNARDGRRAQMAGASHVPF